MDFVLRCNSLKCRALLTDQAVVTTCSHIFCENCTQSLGLSVAHGSNRVCPACQSSLPNPDDAVATALNPSEDYKTSVLSGLTPAVIIECAGRGLAFWSYQSTQEIVYQEYLGKTLTEKYNGSKLEIDQLVNEANSQIDMLTQKLNDVTLDNERLRIESQALAVNLKERAKRHQQTQELYDRLKRKQMTAATQMAAQSAVDETLEDLHWNAANNAGRHSHGSDSIENAEAHAHRDKVAVNQVAPNGLMRPPAHRRAQQAHMVATPHRTRLAQPNIIGSSRLRSSINDIGLIQATPRQRQPLGRISPNVSRLNGIGMVAGVKFGAQNGFAAGNQNHAAIGSTPLRRSPRLAGFAHQGHNSGNGFL